MLRPFFPTFNGPYHDDTHRKTQWKILSENNSTFQARGTGLFNISGARNVSQRGRGFNSSNLCWTESEGWLLDEQRCVVVVAAGETASKAKVRIRDKPTKTELTISQAARRRSYHVKQFGERKYQLFNTCCLWNCQLSALHLHHGIFWGLTFGTLVPNDPVKNTRSKTENIQRTDISTCTAQFKTDNCLGTTFQKASTNRRKQKITSQTNRSIKIMLRISTLGCVNTLLFKRIREILHGTLVTSLWHFKFC